MLRQRLAEARRKMFQKRSIPGWVLFFFWPLVWLSDHWDSAKSFFEKAKSMGPVIHWLITVAQHPVVQLCAFIAGCLWIVVVAFLSSREKLPRASKKPNKEEAP